VSIKRLQICKSEVKHRTPIAWGPVFFISDLDDPGTLQIAAQYESADPFPEGYGSIELRGKRGYTGRSGKLVVPPKYDASDIFSGGLAPCC
jgi:hypothetical protein